MTGKFSSPLAEELHEQSLSSFQDDELGDSETFGWFALFRDEEAILHVDSRGFVSLVDTEDVNTYWMSLSDRWEWFQLAHLDESCDGLSIILDTARRVGPAPDFDEVVGHIEECVDCDALGNFLEV